MNKYYEFYFDSDDVIELSELYWEQYEHDKKETIKKYHNHIFCPICRKAPLSIAAGKKLQYFKVSPNNMNKHDIECPNLLEEATNNEIEEYFNDLSKEDISQKLVSCLNRMIKKGVYTYSGINNSDGDEDNKYGSFIINSKEKNKKYISNISLYSKHINENIDMIKIYYGECLLYKTDSKKYPNKKRNYGYLLHVINIKNKKQICSISISSNVREFIDKEFKNKKEFAEKYYVCFVGKLENNNGFLNCKLEDSRMILIEK